MKSEPESISNRYAGVIADTVNDVAYCLRRLLKRPVFALTLVFTLGLSIGANIAVFTLVNSLLVRALPYSHPERLVLISDLSPLNFPGSPSSFQEWKRDSNLLEDAALYAVGKANLVGATEPENLQVVSVTANFFDVLGVQAHAGRFFVPDEQADGRDALAVISEKLWRSDFSNDASALGRTLLLNGRNYTIVGVAPATCNFPVGTDVWTPTAHDFGALVASSAVTNYLLATLKPGATVIQADAQQRSWMNARLALYADGSKPATSEPVVHSLKDQLIASVKLSTILLFAAVVLVLLIGCANVANLILADSAVREHEFAVRGAIGMSAGRLARQLLTEQLMIALIGGGSGLLMAKLTLPYLKTYLPAEWPKYADLSINFRVFVFALALSIFVGVAVAIAPCWRFARRLGVMTLAHGSRSTDGPASRRWREIVVSIETCLAMILLVAAALCVRTLRSMTEADLGFRSRGVIAATVSRGTGAPEVNNASEIFYSQVLEKLGAIPGVESTGGVDYLPARSEYTMLDRITPVPGGSDSETVLATAEASAPGYFRTMGIPLVRGRDFNEFDDATSGNVVIINQVLAHKFWPGLDPIGRQISSETFKGPATVIGIAEPVRYYGPESELTEEIYVPVSQSSRLARFSFVIRSSSNSATIAPSIKSAIRSVDPSQPVEIEPLEGYVSLRLQSHKGISGGLALLSTLGLVLAIVGVYGLVSYSVAVRTREFGIRMAFGELSGRIFYRSVSSALRAVLPGVALGVIGSIATAGFLKSVLFGVKATDPMTITSVSIAMILTAIIAGAIAARRTTRLDPIAALREE